MANDLTPSFEDVWARTQQDVFLKRSIAMVVADTSFNSTMRAGDVLKRTYRSVTASDVPGLYTRGSDMDDTDIELHVWKWTALYMSRKYEDAFLESKIVLKIDPNNKTWKALQIQSLKEIAKANPEWAKKQLGDN